MSKIIKKKLVLETRDYYTTHIALMNVFLPVKLTPKEIETLATFMSLKGDIREDMFGSSARKIVMKTMGIQPGGLGNYLESLSKKGFILPDPVKKYTIWGMLYPSEKEQFYQFKFEEKNE